MTATLSLSSLPTCGSIFTEALVAGVPRRSNSANRSSQGSGNVVALPFAHRRCRFMSASWARLRSWRYRHSMLKQVNAVMQGLAHNNSNIVHSCAYSSLGGCPRNKSLLSASSGFILCRYILVRQDVHIGISQCAHSRFDGQRCMHLLSSGHASTLILYGAQAMVQVHCANSDCKPGCVSAGKVVT